MVIITHEHSGIYGEWHTGLNLWDLATTGTSALHLRSDGSWFYGHPYEHGFMTIPEYGYTIHIGGQCFDHGPYYN
jgi:hypothetical protein